MLQPLIREDPSDWMGVTGASVRLSHVASSEREREMRKAESQHLNHSQRAPSSDGEKASEPDLEGIQETGSTEPVGPRKTESEFRRQALQSLLDPGRNLDFLLGDKKITSQY